MKLPSFLSLSQLHFAIPVTPLLLFSLFALIFSGWAVFTLIVRYHWKNYGANGVEILTMNYYYFVGSAILLAFMALSAILYFTSSI